MPIHVLRALETSRWSYHTKIVAQGCSNRCGVDLSDFKGRQIPGREKLPVSVIQEELPDDLPLALVSGLGPKTDGLDCTGEIALGIC